MFMAVYAFSRLILFGGGWGVAAAAGFVADMMMSGSFWPLFGLIAGWWTFACAVYIERENAVGGPVNRPM